jgi:hypothetical protein
MNIELPEFPKVVKVSVREVEQLLTDPQWVRNEEVFKELPYPEGYIHTDGRVLRLFRTGSGQLYENLEDFHKEQIGYQIIEQAEQQMWQDTNPFGQDFPQHVTELIDTLAVHLQIPRQQLDGSRESLTRLEKAVERYGMHKSLEFPVFAGLLAYSGEIMIRRTNGRWLMQLDERSGVWEPWVLAADGRTMQIPLSKMLLEESNAFIAALIDLAVTVHPFNKHLINRD